MKRLFSAPMTLVAFAIFALGVTSSAKADPSLDYTVDGTYNSGLGTVSGTFDVDATTDTVESVDLVESASGGIAAYTFSNPILAAYFLYSSPSFYNFSILDDNGNNISLGFDQAGGALATTGFGDSTVSNYSSVSYVLSGTITEGAPTAAPEPPTWAMMISGFCGLGFMTYRKRKNGISSAAA